MVSKGSEYISENDLSTSEDDSNKEQFNTNNQNQDRPIKKSTRRAKCNTKSALMARENRLRKKLYMTKLENEINILRRNHKQYTKVIDSQSNKIGKLEKEITYLKSVIANSTDISNLIRNIHRNTGMSVRTCLNQSLLKTDYVSKPQLPIAKKTPYSWDDDTNDYPNVKFENMNDFQSNSSNICMDDNYLLDELQLDLPNSNPLSLLNDQEDSLIPIKNHLEEHNYNSPNEEAEEVEDCGVCLHVSKHRISLEFCSICNENSANIWKQ